MGDPLAVKLAEIRADHEAANAFGANAGDPLPGLLAAVDAVLELHQPEKHPRDAWALMPGEPDGPYCAGCAIDLGDEDEPAFSSGAWRSWPCPTYRAIAGALLGEENPGDRS